MQGNGCMEIYDAIKHAAETAGLSLAAVSKEVSNSPNYISNAAARGSVPSTTNAARMLAACGWSLMAAPPGSDAPGAIVIDPPAE